MTYRLSLLDKSPIQAGESATSAFARTLRLARYAEELGYHRFWVAEHHNSAELASSAPEVLVAWLLANTSRIRIGSGGVMLQHYSPYKVAEAFNVLAALAPGRVDLGVGKTTGGLPLATAALQANHDPARRQDFETQLATLGTFLSGPAPQDHAFAGLSALPPAPVAPERFLLGASPASATLAAQHGWNYVHAGHLNGDPENLRLAAAAYREHSDGAPVLAISAFASENGEQARARVAELKIFRVFLSNGSAFNLGTRQQAEEFARQSGDSDYRIEERRPAVLAGTAQSIHAELASLARSYGIQEFIIEPPNVSADERLATIELLARAEIPAAA